MLFTFAASWIDPFAHKLGLALLSIQSMQANYASLYNMPLGPWLGFNNTVVSGTVLLGLYAAFPVYWCVKVLCGIAGRRSAA